MKVAVQLKNNRRIADLDTGTKTINFPIKVLNTTEVRYKQEIHSMGDKEFHYKNPVREVVKRIKNEKLEALTVRGQAYKDTIIQCRREKEEIGGEICLLEFQLLGDVRKLTEKEVITLVDIALEAGFTDIKIPDRGMSLEDYKRTFLLSSKKILGKGKKLWGYLNITDPSKLFQEKAKFLQNTGCFGICFHYGVLKTNAENYLFVLRQMANLNKWLHLTFCEARDWRFERKTSAQNLLGVIFDSVSLRMYKPPLKDGKFEDVPKEAAMLFSEADTGYYTLHEHQSIYGINAEFVSEANFLLFEDLNTMEEILTEFAQRHKLNVITKVFSAIGVSSELEKFAAARRAGIETEMQYLDSKIRLKEGLLALQHK